VELEDPSGERRNCGTQFPDHPVCHELPSDYTYHSVQQALNAVKQRLGAEVPYRLVGLPVAHE
jgi:hypothetical protein